MQRGAEGGEGGVQGEERWRVKEAQDYTSLPLPGSAAAAEAAPAVIPPEQYYSFLRPPVKTPQHSARWPIVALGRPLLTASGAEDGSGAALLMPQTTVVYGEEGAGAEGGTTTEHALGVRLWTDVSSQPAEQLMLPLDGPVYASSWVDTARSVAALAVGKDLLLVRKLAAEQQEQQWDISDAVELATAPLRDIAARPEYAGQLVSGGADGHVRLHDLVPAIFASPSAPALSRASSPLSATYDVDVGSVVSSVSHMLIGPHVVSCTTDSGSFYLVDTRMQQIAAGVQFEEPLFSHVHLPLGSAHVAAVGGVYGRLDLFDVRQLSSPKGSVSTDPTSTSARQQRPIPRLAALIDDHVRDIGQLEFVPLRDENAMLACFGRPGFSMWQVNSSAHCLTYDMNGVGNLGHPWLVNNLANQLPQLDFDANLTHGVYQAEHGKMIVTDSNGIMYVFACNSFAQAADPALFPHPGLSAAQMETQVPGSVLEPTTVPFHYQGGDFLSPMGLA